MRVAADAPADWEPSAHLEDSRAGSWRVWYAVVLIAFVSFISNVDRSIINLLVEPIKRDLEISDTSVSLIVGFAHSLFYMLFGLPMARLSDVFNRKIMITSALAFWSFATALCGLAQNFWQLFAARGLVGAGESVKGPCSMSMISDLVPKHHLPRAFAIYQMGITAGQSGALVIGGLLIAMLSGLEPIQIAPGFAISDWHLVFLICGIPGLLLAAVMAFTIKEPKRKGRRVQGSVPIRQIFGFVGANYRIYLPLLLSVSISSVEAFGLAIWRPAFFERTYGWGPEIIGPILGIIVLVATPIGLFIGTMMAEHFVRQGRSDAMLRVCFYSHIISFVPALAMPLMPSPWLAVVMCILATIANAIAGPGQNSAVQIITPNEMRGQVTAVYLFTISVVGGGLGPTAIALITDNVFGDEMMLQYAIALFVGVIGPLGILTIWLALKPYARAVGLIEMEQGVDKSEIERSK